MIEIPIKFVMSSKNSAILYIPTLVLSDEHFPFKKENHTVTVVLDDDKKYLLIKEIEEDKIKIEEENKNGNT